MHCNPNVGFCWFFEVNNSSKQLRDDGHIVGSVGYNSYLFLCIPIGASVGGCPVAGGVEVVEGLKMKTACNFGFPLLPVDSIAMVQMRSRVRNETHLHPFKEASVGKI